MTVTKVVGFGLRIPKHFSLHFYDFSTFLYGIYKFAVFENKRKRKRTFASRPLDFSFFSREVLGGTGQNRGGSGGCFPARFGPGGEGKVGEKGEGARAHLPVVSIGAEVACGGLSAGAGGRGRSCVAAAPLRRGRESEEWSGSFRGRSWSDSRV